MHDSAHRVFGRRVLGTTRALEIRGSGADENEAGVRLVGIGISAVLRNEVVDSEFGAVQGAVEVDVDNA